MSASVSSFSNVDKNLIHIYYLLERPTWGLGVLYSVGSPPRSISVRPAKCRDLETKICALARIKVQLSLVNSARLMSALADTVCIATLDESLSRKTLASLPQPPYVETTIGMHSQPSSRHLASLILCFLSAAYSVIRPGMIAPSILELLSGFTTVTSRAASLPRFHVGNKMSAGRV